MVIPAYQAEGTLAQLLAELEIAQEEFNQHLPVLVIDDGSSDATSAVARASGAVVVRHPRNRGKGAALQTALAWAAERGMSCMVTLDADGQHPPRAAVALSRHLASPGALLLGVRDLVAAGAPAANQWSNQFSNRVLSLFAGARLLDTQCGLRRYPVVETRKLGATDAGYAFEADVVLRAARTGLAIEHVPTPVIYPPDRVSHFDSVADPARIVLRVVRTTLSVPHHRPLRRWTGRLLVLLVGCALLGAALGLVT